MKLSKDALDRIKWMKDELDMAEEQVIAFALRFLEKNYYW